MATGPVLLDTDTLSELSRGHASVMLRARTYLAEYGRLTISAVTVFERLRGYRHALRAGKPFQRQLGAFEALVRNCIVIPFDEDAADVAATIWSSCSRRQQNNLGDILIASTAVTRQIALATRNSRDFEALRRASGVELILVDWSQGKRANVR
jgi:predicted nucleic acid-binding protein